MKLQSLQYIEEKTGIIFEVDFKDGKKHITVRTRHDDDEFMFKNSKPETLIKIGESLLSIGAFCDTMKVDGVCEYSYNIGPTISDVQIVKYPNLTATYINDDLNN